MGAALRVARCDADLDGLTALRAGGLTAASGMEEANGATSCSGRAEDTSGSVEVVEDGSSLRMTVVMRMRFSGSTQRPSSVTQPRARAAPRTPAKVGVALMASSSRFSKKWRRLRRRTWSRPRA